LRARPLKLTASVRPLGISPLEGPFWPYTAKGQAGLILQMRCKAWNREVRRRLMLDELAR